ncbi:glycoside hydrolase family 3 C-terminal domain-containing protein [Rhodococcus sp. T2V]|uniref:glycoside hydrolase family 3 protein n=1 Tax=Rhodococcus sp. T2V TaxID=3034164 RepID=UPI0023E0B220|nr:glycoside hydrolase family 3 C-terminal domain-containing protein [Rhodococcus sp. T2V]MDF3312687.1 glycoside hydrolase family 3 C-terminal domain-containing protein [Rhodococcus sp. T2V]
MWIDEVLVLDKYVTPVGDMLGASVITPPAATVPVQVRKGRPVSIRIEHDITEDAITGFLAFQFGIEEDVSRPEALIAEAVETARAADVAIVVVGTNSRVESEGIDRTSLDLPGLQNELVRAVASVNPNVIIVANSGAPVELPWRNDVAAVMLTWFGGQEYGNALADVLTGEREPGGRLPTTWPVTQQDARSSTSCHRTGASTTRKEYTSDIGAGSRPKPCPPIPSDSVWDTPRGQSTRLLPSPRRRTATDSP